MGAKREVQKKGAARMAQLGYRQVQIWLSAVEVEAILAKYPGARLATLARCLMCKDVGIGFKR